MTPLVKPFDLDALEDGLHLPQLIEEQFKASVITFSKVGQGFYAHIYKALLNKDPGQVIVKCHKYAGRGEKEKRQLEILKRHAAARVPQVYSLHFPSALLPCEALTMEFIPGVNASKIQFPDDRSRRRFVDSAVENLLAWHTVTNAEGFGELEGPFFETWAECFGQRIALYHEHIHKKEHRTVVSAYVMGVIDRSFEDMERIFLSASENPSLVHSDYNAWNMMVDARSYELTGIIDPIDAGWCDYEIDLFHLANCRPELGLLERYLKEIEVDEFFWLRYRFYRFWDDVKHYLRVGWYGEERFRGYAKELETAMNECLY
jgi:aminoglycoside phosphotransferase (APT) family kinase protein